MKKATIMTAVCVCASMLSAGAAEGRGDMRLGSVVWHSPSKNSMGSMPIGNGDCAANVWVEPSGDIVLLLSKSDSYDEFNRLLKLGRIRIRTTPSLVQAGGTFRQELDLENGVISIATSNAQESGPHSPEKVTTRSVRIWIDANNPVVQVDLQSDTPIEAKATLEIWRTERRKLKGREEHSANGNRPEKMRVNPDTLLPHSATSIAWCHHNIESQWEANLKLTGLGEEIKKKNDPILNRTFGCVVRGDGFAAVSDTVLKTEKPFTSASLRIYPLTQMADTPQAWRKAAEAMADKVPADSAKRFKAHRDWWHQYWEQSWIVASAAESLTVPVNRHSWSVGEDSRGGSRFGGSIRDVKVIGRRLSSKEIAALAQRPRTETTGVKPDADCSKGCTVAAWINPIDGEKGRILDKCTPGGSDGLVFDTSPGLALRWIVGGTTLVAKQCLKAGEWQHVAATVDPDSGALRIYRDGKLIKESVHDGNAADLVTQAYALQRYVTACAARGGLPIKFNGSLFTVDQIFTPDYRQWGGGYWFMNTRLIYWAMLYSGDYDQMLPLFKMYMDALPLRKAATKKYYGHEGAFFPETMYFWGNYLDKNYGTDREGKPDGLLDNHYIRRYWQGGLELVTLMLEYYDATQDTAFRDKTLIPMAKAITLFFDQHWKRDKDGKVYYSPAQALETWWNAVNPMPEVAGLHYLLPRLLELPVDAATQKRWKQQLEDQPAIPATGEGPHRRLLPAATYSNLRNMENPELYAVFPYRLYTLMQGDDKRRTGINTWKVRRNKENIGWQQHPVQAALLGLSDEAKDLVIERARDKARGYRFPGFYGPNYDWTPDQDQISVYQIGLQRMVMQCEGDAILLLPAWPKEWNVTFKLHAPKQTVVEGEVRGGKVVTLNVTPASRRNDVEVCAPFELVKRR